MHVPNHPRWLIVQFHQCWAGFVKIKGWSMHVRISDESNIPNPKSHPNTVYCMLRKQTREGNYARRSMNFKTEKKLIFIISSGRLTIAKGLSIVKRDGRKSCSTVVLKHEDWYTDTQNSFRTVDHSGWMVDCFEAKLRISSQFQHVSSRVKSNLFDSKLLSKHAIHIETCLKMQGMIPKS